MGCYSAVFSNTWSEGSSNPPWTLLWAAGGHPNGTNSGAAHDAVRRWTSGLAGTLTVTGNHSAANGGMTALSVVVDGTPVWGGLTSAAPQGFALSSRMAAGSTVDFVINSDGVDCNDSTNFAVTGTVTAVPEPASGALLLAGLGGLSATGLRLRRRAGSPRAA
jgi:hypothetical protein